MKRVCLDSGGDDVRGVFYAAADPAATLLLLPGFPGNEDDVLDLGASLSGRGFNALMFNYRGTYRSQGAFTLAGTVNRLFSLSSLSDTCCLVLTRENFREVIDQFPDSRQNIITGLIENIISWEEKFLNENIDCTTCLKTIGVSLI